jgi:hypothetical protein
MGCESTTTPQPGPLGDATITYTCAAVGDRSAISEPRQGGTNAIKPQNTSDIAYFRRALAAPHILVLVTCLAYIVATIMTFNIGLHNISMYLKPQVELAQLELQVQRDIKYREQALHIRLDEVVDTQLSRNFLETYEDCLARGLGAVDQQLFGLGFQYPDIRDRTIAWTMGNCKRLLYTPQLLHPRVQRAFWTRGTYRLRHITEKTLNLIVHQASSFWTWWFMGLNASSSEVTVSLLFPWHVKMDDRTRNDYGTPEHLKMPFGFALQCESSSPCQLVYSQTISANVDKAFISDEAIAESMRNFHQLYVAYTGCNTIQAAVISVAMWFISSEILLLGIYAFFTAFYLGEQEQINTVEHEYISFVLKRVTRRFTIVEQRAGVCIAFQLLVMFVHGISDRGSGRNLILGTGILAIMASVLAMINFFVPLPQFEDVFTVCGAMHELYVITSPNDSLRSEPLALSGVQKQENGNASVAEGDIVKTLAGREATGRKPTSPSTLPLGTPTTLPIALLTTTLQQDVQKEFDAMREAQKQAYVELDTGSESDGEGYIDLAGGITPTTTEDVDWCVVDA